MSTYKIFYSFRHIPLVYMRDQTYDPPDVPTLTIENYCKWYNLYLVNPNGGVEEIQFPNLPEDLPPGLLYGYNNHVPNPAAVLYMAEKHGWYLDAQSWEMIVGRWCAEELELESLYPNEEKEK